MEIRAVLSQFVAVKKKRIRDKQNRDVAQEIKVNLKS